MPVRPIFLGDSGSVSTGAVNSVNGKQGDVVLTAESINAQLKSQILTEISSVTMPNNTFLRTNNKGEFIATTCMPAGVAWLSYTTVDQQKEHLALSDVASSGRYQDLEDAPDLFSGDYNDLSNKPNIIPVPTKTSELTNDSGFLTSVPEQPQQVPQVNADWLSNSGVSQVLNKPTLFSGAYSDLSGKPVLFSGNYSDLVGKPAIFSGSYTDLTNKPEIPVVNYPVISVNSKTGSVNLTASDVGAIAAGAQIPYSSLTGVPTSSGLQVNSDWNSTSGVSQILNKPVLFDGTWFSLSDKPTTFTPSAHAHSISDVTGLQSALDSKINTGSSIPYTSLTNPPVIPTNTNQLTNGSGYITNSALSGYALTSSLSAYATTASTAGLRKVETFLGTSDASGNVSITFTNTYTTSPDIQPQIIGGTFNQMVRVVSVSNTGCVVQAGQRNTVTLLSTEVLLGATVALTGASVTIQVTPRN